MEQKSSASSKVSCCGNQYEAANVDKIVTAILSRTGKLICDGISKKNNIHKKIAT